MALAKPPEVQLSTDLQRTAERAKEYMRQAKAANTIRAYRSDWRHFTEWCTRQQLPFLPASQETVTLYLTELAATAKTSTLQRRLSAIAQAHRTAELPIPTTSADVRLAWAGIRRQKGTVQEPKAPILVGDLRRMVATCDSSILGIRDRVLLLVGFAGAFRRSELVSLDAADLTFGASGVTIRLRRSKTDQEGHGEKVGIPWGTNADTCPVSALKAWLEAAGISVGPVFRPVDRHSNIKPQRLSDRAVALIVKRHAEAAGLEAEKYSGHSLRAGLATSAAMGGASERAIMRQTRHRSLPMVRRYIREGDLFRENAAAQVGL